MFLQNVKTSNLCAIQLLINYLQKSLNNSLFRLCLFITQTNYSFGYAFINFVTEEGAQRAIKCLNGVTVRNKRLKVSFGCCEQYRQYIHTLKLQVSYARPAGEEIKDTNLYVTNLPKTITEEAMDVIFGKYGLIVQKNILRDKITGKPRGVAFIRFNKREEAQEAIAALNNVIPEGGSQPLTVRVAEEHGKSKAQQMFGHAMTSHQQQQHQQHLGGGGSGSSSGGGMGSGSSMTMLNYPMGGMPMSGVGVGGSGSAGHFHHQSNAMHRGRQRVHHQMNNLSGGPANPHHHQNHNNHHRYASRPY